MNDPAASSGSAPSVFYDRALSDVRMIRSGRNSLLIQAVLTTVRNAAVPAVPQYSSWENVTYQVTVTHQSYIR